MRLIHTALCHILVSNLVNYYNDPEWYYQFSNLWVQRLFIFDLDSDQKNYGLVWFGLVSLFNGISTFEDYLITKLSLVMNSIDNI